MILTYDEIHKLIREVCGPASEYLCVACDGTARDWAFQYPEGGVLRDDNGFAYSEDLNAYAPMCHGCHARFDHQKDPDRMGRGLAAVSSRRKTDSEFDNKMREAAKKGLATVEERRESDPEFAERMRNHSRSASSLGGAAHRKRIENNPAHAEHNRENARKGGIKGGAVVAEKRKNDHVYADRMREAAIRTVGKINALRRRCDECGMVSNPGSIGRHQKYSGHVGWEYVES